MATGRVSFSDQRDERERVLAEARALGFDAAGVARADEPLTVDFERWSAFTADGKHGEMRWLAAHPEPRLRLDRATILEGARSVVCVARRVPPGADGGSGDPGIARHIARYARGRDYHGFMRRRLRRLATFVRSLGTPGAPVAARPLCDEEPVLERAWAVRAGLGFVGKNGMLIVPGLGSMVMLGEVVTTLDLGPPAEAWEERCGSCARCLDACPTRAFDAPFVLDPRRCVSYLTIELRSAIPVELRAGVGEHLFGCDDCQTVCPFNAGARAREHPEAPDGDPFAPLARWPRTTLEALLAMDDAAWRAVSEGTPLKRAGPAGLARNSAVVLGNRGDPAALPALRRAAAGARDPLVREAAEWAAARVEESVRVAKGGG